MKRAHYGQHHHYSKRYTHLYISEACYKYNTRKVSCGFENAIALMVAA